METQPFGAWNYFVVFVMLAISTGIGLYYRFTGGKQKTAETIIMIVAVCTVLIKGTVDAGGLQNVWDIAKEGGRIQFFDFNPNPTVRHTFWSLTIGGMFTCLSLYAVNQAQVQRLLTVKSLKKSQQALWLNWP
ncbi:UNVERIFIED_CONTAM: hypothetical protein B566_EDAN019550, partial [Ephemera danica]